MDVFNKFIISNGDIVIGKVTYHKQLIWDLDSEIISGGGWFIINCDDKTITFYGDSYDFGEAKFEDIKKCVDEHRVFSSPLKNNEISGKYKLKYKTDDDEIIDLN